MNDFQILRQVTIESEPDVLLFSPLDSSLLVVGTYHLVKESGQREGKLLLYRIEEETKNW